MCSLCRSLNDFDIENWYRKNDSGSADFVTVFQLFLAGLSICSDWSDVFV